MDTLCLSTTTLDAFFDSPPTIQQATDPMTRFLSSRLLFLITISGGEPIGILVEDLNIANYLSRRLLKILDEISTPSSKPPTMQAEILTEYLKVAFNVSLFYPRVAEEHKILPGNENLSSQGENVNKQKVKGKGKATSSSPMTKSTSSSSTSSSTKSDSRSSSPSENTTTGRTSPRTSSSDIRGTTSGSSTATNGRLRSTSNLPKAATEKIKGYFSRYKGKGKVSNMYHDDADVLRPWGFDK